MWRFFFARGCLDPCSAFPVLKALKGASGFGLAEGRHQWGRRLNTETSGVSPLLWHDARGNNWAPPEFTDFSGLFSMVLPLIELLLYIEFSLLSPCVHRVEMAPHHFRPRLSLYLIHIQHQALLDTVLAFEVFKSDPNGISLLLSCLRGLLKPKIKYTYF